MTVLINSGTGLVTSGSQIEEMSAGVPRWMSSKAAVQNRGKMPTGANVKITISQNQGAGSQCKLPVGGSRVNATHC